ncbi:glycosyltransferase family 2 protein [Falsigemmobacter faecalis]|uniref:Galectin domain-containing protein n=1 Tax=Falsigemmobacter faecalis TaxID=2488730 RepID=A0A3P3DT04_9RHOB|nr:glycosyltransferase family 2 protein [Falsigemmobacter faecalis]RRH77251.1 hypothetical protein EG244_03350 [Falsigemmobacter faecalis]
MKLLLCQVTDGFSVEFSLEAREGQWHQLNFRRLRSAEIPLHLSLRPAEKVVLISRFRNGVWGKPRSLPLSADETLPLAVSVSVVKDGLELRLNGVLSAGLSRQRLDLSAIDCLELPPDLIFGTLKVKGDPAPQIVVPELKFGEDLMIYGYDLPLGDDPALVTLEIAGTDITLPCACERPQTGRAALSSLQAVLPGFLWSLEGVGESLSAKIGPPHAAPEQPELILTRAAVVSAIEALAQRCPDPLQSRFEVISALEHVKYAGLLPRLSPQTVAYIRRATESYQLSAFMDLPEAEDPSAALPPPSPPQSLEEVLIAGWKSEVTALLASAEEGRHGDILTAAAAHLPAVAPEVTEQALLVFTEHFCRIGNFDALYAVWRRACASREGRFRASDGEGISLALPWLAMRGSFEELAERLEALAGLTTGWLNTAAIGQAVRASVLTPDPGLGLERMQRIIFGFLTLSERMAASYWGRGPCRNMIATSVALLMAAPRLPVWLRDRIERSALRCHGFSPTFWQRLAADLPDFAAGSLLLARGQAGFAAVQSHAEARAAQEPGDPAALRRALRFFAQLEVFGTERMRIELLGPTGLLTQSEEADCQSEGFRSELIRALAFPDAPAAPERFHAPAREAVRRLRDPERISESHEPLRELTRLTLKILSGGAEGGEPGDLDNLQAGLLSLRQDRSPHLRFNVALLVYCDALRVGHRALQRLLEPLIGRLLAQTPDLTINDPVVAAAAARLSALMTPASAGAFQAALLAQLTARLSHPVRRGEVASDWRARWLQTPALFDTLVLVYSCKANLATRVARIRETWMRDLEALGIPCLIVVGDGDGSPEGDVLRVSAGDTYEALPAKSLAMLAWAAEHTPFSHILKIDDDCYLDVQEYFCSLSHRLCDYHGRVIKRDAGQKPSAWHMSRSQSLRARMELDKSPEPSAYTDGGSGYALSRRSLLALRAQAESSAGQRLRSVSYSEDKLVGDLLALAGIAPQQKDCNAMLMRRVHDGGAPVVRWCAGFFPSAISGTKIAHLDTHDAFREISRGYQSLRLSPPMIWPANRAVTLHHQSPHMVLVSPPERLQAAREAAVAVISVVRNEKFILRHFLNHYRRLGVTSFLFVDNMSDDGTLEFLLEQPDTLVFTAEAPFRSTAQGSEWKIALMAQLRPGKWSLVADADELLIYGDHRQTRLAEFVCKEDFADSDAFAVSMLDIYPKGRLQEAALDAGDPFQQASHADCRALLHTPTISGPYGEAVARTSALRHRLLPGSGPELFVSEKVALLKYQPWMRFSVSLHYATEVKLAPKPLMFAHFKYHAEFLNRARAEVTRGQYFNGAQEYKRYLSLLSEARDVLYEEGVSVPWERSDLAREVLGEG